MSDEFDDTDTDADDVDDELAAREAIITAYAKGRDSALTQFYAAIGRQVASQHFPDLVKSTEPSTNGHPATPSPEVALLLATLDHRITSLESGTLDDAAGDILQSLWDDPESLREILLSPHGVGNTGDDEPRHLKSWSEQSHPRADDGRFVSAGEIRSATRDPKKAEALRATVTDPEQRKKLDTQLETASPLAGQDRSDATLTHATHESLGKASPDLHADEGHEHADLARGHLIALINAGDVEGIKKADKKLAHNATVHWSEAKAKAIKQFKEDYPGGDLSAVRAAFDTALEQTKEAYDSLTTKAANYAALVKKGGGVLDDNAADFRKEFETAVHELKGIYDAQQNKVWDAIEATRDKLGGKAKGYKLGRYFKAWDESLHPRNKSGIWISRERIHEAKSNPALAAELREEVKPADAQKLDDALSGKTNTGRTVSGVKKEATAAKRAKQTATRADAKRLASELMLASHAPDPKKLRDLAHHLQSGDLRVAELRDIRLKLGAKFGGGRKMEQMVNALKSHVAVEVDNLKPREPDAHELSRQEFIDSVSAKIAPKHRSPALMASIARDAGQMHEDRTRAAHASGVMGKGTADYADLNAPTPVAETLPEEASPVVLSSPSREPAPASESLPPELATVPTLDAQSALDTHASIDEKVHPTRAAAEAVAHTVPGAGVAKIGSKWHALAPLAPKPASASLPSPTGSVTGLDDAEFAKKVQETADTHTHGFGTNKVFIGHVFDKLKAEDPSLTREEFNRRLNAANADNRLTLSRADLVQTMHPDDVRSSETASPLGDRYVNHFVLAANKERTNRGPDAGLFAKQQPRRPRGPSDYAPPTEEEFAAASQPAPKTAPVTPASRPLARLSRPGGGENSHEQMPAKPTVPASESLPVPASTESGKSTLDNSPLVGDTAPTAPIPGANREGKKVEPNIARIEALDAEIAKHRNAINSAPPNAGKSRGVARRKMGDAYKERDKLLSALGVENPQQYLPGEWKSKVPPASEPAAPSAPAPATESLPPPTAAPTSPSPLTGKQKERAKSRIAELESAIAGHESALANGMATGVHAKDVKAKLRTARNQREAWKAKLAGTSEPASAATESLPPLTESKAAPAHPAAVSPDALASDPGADRRTLAALASQHAPKSKARDYLETAAHNLHQDDIDVPAIERRRDTVKQLAEMHQAAHKVNDPETAAHVAAALKHFGAELHGPQSGEPTAFDGRYHESEHPAFTGDQVQVTRQPVVLPGAGGAGQDYIASKGKVIPVSRK